MVNNIRNVTNKKSNIFAQKILKGCKIKKERKKERKTIYFPKHSVNNMIVLYT